MKISFLKLNIKNIMMGAFLVATCFFIFSPKITNAYSASQIIDDSVFRASGTMSESQIQSFLASKGSPLANYTIPAGYNATYWIGDHLVTSYINPWIGPIGAEVNATGWPVSRVIYMASQWYNVNPQVTISILQKESSMITDPTIRTAPEYFGRMAWIMGYAYTESADPIVNVCDTATNYNPTGSCAGVAMQIDWAMGSLDNWYNKSMNHTLTCNGGQACWPGNVVTIDGIGVYIGNYITGPFYRYTPHLSWGGTFAWCMQNWFTPYDYEFVSASNPPPVLGAGETVAAQIKIKNIGGATWKNDSLDQVNPIRLYVASGSELYPGDSTWESPIRIKMTTPSVANGEIATFDFNIKTPMTIGTFNLHMIPRVENIDNMKDLGMVFTVTTPTWHSYQFISAINPPASMQPGQNYDVSVILKNTGSAVWNNDTIDPSFRPMRLAVISGSPNYYESTTWVSTSRIKMTTPTVKYGQQATFNFKMKAPTIPGYYVIKFVPIIENLIQYNDIGMAFGGTVENDGSVFRYWNKNKGGHFFTSSVQEKITLDKDLNWQYEGKTFVVDYVTSAGLSPVYRFWNSALGSHFYTISNAEKTLIQNTMPSWQYEGIAWFSRTTTADGYVPVYRFWSSYYKRHFYTSSLEEKNYVDYFYPDDIWKYEGIAWYAK